MNNITPIGQKNSNNINHYISKNITNIGPTLYSRAPGLARIFNPLNSHKSVQIKTAHFKLSSALLAVLFALCGSNALAAPKNNGKMSEEEYREMMAKKKSQVYENFIAKNNNNFNNSNFNNANSGTTNLNMNQGESHAAFDSNLANPIEASGNKLINCWDEASKTYKVDPWLIFAYAKTESSFKPNAVNANRSSIDRGLMQINSIWLPTLAKYNITTNHLFDSCVSIFVGTWIIRQNIDRYGYTYHGLVAYNVGNPYNPKTASIARQYYSKLNANYEQLTRAYRK